MDLRQFLADLGDDVLTVRERVSCLEIPKRIEAEEKSANRAIVFEAISDYPGRVVGNIFGSSSRIAASLNTTDFKAFYDKIDRAIAAPCDIGLVSNYDERDYTKISKPDLAKQLPQIIHSEFDSTPYITSGVVLVRHPESDRHHLCFVRLSLQEGNRFLFNPRTFRIKEIADKTLGAGKPLDIVVLIGAPTEVFYRAASASPMR